MTGTVRVDAADVCTVLLAQSHSGAGADYVPGVDVRGNPVAPADAPGSYGWTGDETISVNVELAGRYGIAPRGAGKWVKLSLGEFVIKGNQVYLNGRSLTPEDRTYLIIACRQHKKDR